MRAETITAKQNVDEPFTRIVMGRDQKIVDHRQRWKQPDVLPGAAQAAADALMELERVKRLAAKHDRAGVRLHHTGDQIEQRRLPSTIRAHQPPKATPWAHTIAFRH